MARRPAAAGEACLSPAELGAMRKLYDGASNSTGRLAFAGGGGLPRGSEYTWSPVYVNEAGRHGLIISSPSLIQQLIQYKVFYQDPGTSMTLMDFDFERDVPRLALTEAFYNAQNPDLRRFKARGGKLLAYHGWDDTEVTPGYSVDYYETATRTMGGPEATRDFYRLFMVPGMGHCRRGNGADAIDYLDALERWVEQGEAPEKLVAHKLVKEQSYLGLPRPRYPLKPEEYRWRRPVYAYPDVAVFTGRGDSADPANWKPRRLPPADGSACASIGTGARQMITARPRRVPAAQRLCAWSAVLLGLGAAAVSAAESGAAIRQRFPADEAPYLQRVELRAKLMADFETYDTVEPVPGAKRPTPLPTAGPDSRTIDPAALDAASAYAASAPRRR